MKIKGYILFIPLVFLIVSFQNLFAQELSDENTYLISQYFQQSKEMTLIEQQKKSISTNLNIVSLNQIGDKNQIDIKSNNNNSQEVVQKGNNNYYNFINYYNSNPSNFNILQQGNSNSLQIYGENSIIENMSILQKSNFKTIIITNY
jgi:hypothetical protein